MGPQAFRARAPAGRALLKTAAYRPPREEPDADYPLRFTTGRTAYHFHTRTKTGRARPRSAAAPKAWVELAVADADMLGISEGDMVRGSSRRGHIDVPARVSSIRPGTVFTPFHYSYWDADGSPGLHPTAANELTLTKWDPVSKQPMFKNAAVRVVRIGEATGPATAGGEAAQASEFLIAAPPPRFPGAIPALTAPPPYPGRPPRLSQKVFLISLSSLATWPMCPGSRRADSFMSP